MKIGFQGIHGAYSEIASKNFFEGKDCEFIGLKNFEEIFTGVHFNNLDYGVIPIENSLAGTIHKNVDLLNLHELKIIGEIKLKVEHNLLGIKGSKLENIKEVYSHWQALAQCEESIKKSIPNASIREYFDTAGSAEYIKNENNLEKACIASSLAAEIYNLEVLEKNFEDNKNNYTRFVVISRDYASLQSDENLKFKTSITFSGNSVAGFLYSILKCFADRNINLTKIESRPIPEQTWNYYFYIDFEGRFDEENAKNALESIKEITPDLKILGSYIADN